MAVWELRCAIRRLCRNRSISAVAVITLLAAWSPELQRCHRCRFFARARLAG